MDLLWSEKNKMQLASFNSKMFHLDANLQAQINETLIKQSNSEKIYVHDFDWMTGQMK